MKSSYLQFEQGYRNFSMTSGIFGGGSPFGMYSVGDNITIVIKNTKANAEEVDILSTQQPPGVIVAANTIPISKLITRIQANPMMVESMKINVSDPQQLSNPILLVYRDALGSYQSAQIIPEAYKSSFQTISNMVEIPNVNALLDVNSTMTTVMNPNTQMSLTFKVKQLFNNKRDFNQYLEFMAEKKFRNFMRQINI